MHDASALALTMFRGYDSAFARWLSEDPAGASDGLNLYRYVSNGPINRLDRFGLAGQKCWDKLTVTSVLSCSAELVDTSGVCWGAKGQVKKLCDDLKDEIAKKKAAELQSVGCPSGETCQDKKLIENFQAVNETLTVKKGPCTATIRLNGQFVGRGEIGTCRDCPK